MINNKVTWTVLKSLQSSKSVPFQYVEDSNSYTIIIDDSGVEFYARILKTSPSNSDQTDFENNYKSSANSKNFLRIRLTDSAGNEIGPSQTVSGTTYLPVVLAASATPGSAVVARSIQIAGSDGTNARTIATNSSGHTIITGSVASGAADSNNPVKVGGVYNASLPTFTTGQRSDLQTDNNGRLLVLDASQYVSPFTPYRLNSRSVIAASVASTYTSTLASNVNITQFYIGGRVACEGTLAKYTAATTQSLPNGGFNSSGDVSAWTNTSAGDTALVSWAYSTAQAYEGTGSAAINFPKSDSNNYPELTYTWGSTQDLSSWRYIRARARVTVAAGGVQTREIQVRMTSGTAVRIWNLSGTTTTAPFSTEQWHTITGELRNPTATAGTGTFDIQNVNSVSLRLVDGGNKTGTIYWDNIEFLGALDIKDKIYSAAGDTTTINFNPGISFSSGDSIALISRNNSSSSNEIQIAISGVIA